MGAPVVDVRIGAYCVIVSLELDEPQGSSASSLADLGGELSVDFSSMAGGVRPQWSPETSSVAGGVRPQW